MNNERNITEKAPDLSIQITKILAIGRWTEKGMILSDRLPVMKKKYLLQLVYIYRQN
jgi:hypothetical protein